MLVTMELWLSVGGLVVGALITLRPVRVRVGRRGDITVVLAIGARRLCWGRAVDGTWRTLRSGPPSFAMGLARRAAPPVRPVETRRTVGCASRAGRAPPRSPALTLPGRPEGGSLRVNEDARVDVEPRLLTA